MPSSPNSPLTTTSAGATNFTTTCNSPVSNKRRSEFKNKMMCCHVLFRFFFNTAFWGTKKLHCQKSDQIFCLTGNLFFKNVKKNSVLYATSVEKVMRLTKVFLSHYELIQVRGWMINQRLKKYWMLLFWKVVKFKYMPPRNVCMSPSSNL